MATCRNHILPEFENLCKLRMVFATSARPGEFAFGMEGKVFQQVLEIGRTVMLAYLTAQAAFYRAKTATHPDGSEQAYSGERRGTYYSVFGEIIYSRSYYRGGGKAFYPMEAAINLPPKGSSDFVRKMTEELAVNCSFELATTFMAEHFPLATSARALQEAVQTYCLDAESHYGCAPVPPSSEQETILVVEADGKGVPMILEVPPTPPEPGKQKGPPKREGKKGETVDASAAFFHCSANSAATSWNPPPSRRSSAGGRKTTIRSMPSFTTAATSFPVS